VATGTVTEDGALARQWLISTPAHDRDTFAHRCDVSPIVAQLLLNRGLDGAESTARFLQPQLKDLYAPHLLPGVTRAGEIIADAVRRKSKIVLYGDYDVDGTTGLAILWHVIRRAGVDVAFYVPHRVEEGYGLNLEAVKRLIAEGAQLIVSIDCGITAVEVARAARAAGAKLIITDHHAPHGEIPDADAIVHPIVGGKYPNPDICGAGVAFKLAWALAQQWSGSDRVAPEFRQLLMDLLPLVALGTIADVVPITGENRVIAKHGLSGLATTKWPGIRALMESANLDPTRVSGYDVGFKLAPRINAAGRMGHARLAVELLTRADDARSREIALYLEDHNRQRQATERRITKDAVELIDKNNLAGDARRAIVLASEGWHVGVIGIVAARIVERYHRPTVMISLSNGEGQGSARSVKHFALNEALAACGEHLLSFGGHAMAAGLRIDSKRVASFTEVFVGVANDRLTGDDLKPKLRLDAEVALSALTVPTVEAITSLGPFGIGNPRPKFATGWLELADEPRLVGSGQKHLQAALRENGTMLKAIGFGLADEIENLKRHRRCRVAFEPIINDFNGRRTVEVQILDLQYPS